MSHLGPRGILVKSASGQLDLVYIVYEFLFGGSITIYLLILSRSISDHHLNLVRGERHLAAGDNCQIWRQSPYRGTVSVFKETSYVKK